MRLEGIKGGIYKRGKIWWIYYSIGERLPGKASKSGKPRYKQIREAIGERKLAIITLQKRNVQIAEGKHLDKKPPVLFSDYADRYLKEHSITLRSYYNDKKNMPYLNKFFGEKYLHKTTRQDVEQFKIENSDTPVATNRRLSLLHGIFNRAITYDKYIRDNPCTGVKHYPETPRDRVLTEDEIDRLFSNCTDKRLELALIIALNTALRSSNIFGLKWSDIDFDGGWVNVARTKNGKPLSIPMTQELKDALINYPRYKTCEYVFCTPDGIQLKSLRKPFTELVKKCKIINFTFHDLRHTCGTFWKTKGMDNYFIQQLLGHKDPKMTLRYLNLSHSYLKEAIEKTEKVSTNLSQG